ncbi:MAG: hypothetical protein KDD70_00265 [Bdellovibrionales bacterium]|nr:hypothetical protein [Bdellovibrionales bacterium]
MNSSTYQNLRMQFPVFRYEGFTLELENQNLVIHYNFSIEGLTSFISTFVFPEGRFEQTSIVPLLSRLGMIEALSYWKATCSPRFEIQVPDISSDEFDFWQHLYWEGLSEFRYRNVIKSSKEAFVNFSSSGTTQQLPCYQRTTTGNLVPIGGGKDSIVTLELLKPFRESNHLFYLNPRPACIRSGELGGYTPDQTTTVTRTLDKELFRLNKEGFLNGHTPYSALLAFTSLVTAALLEKEYIVLSNEGSASEGNVAGESVNHQYSKSLEFENSFRDYVRQFLTGNINYFSLLRPLHEAQIGKLFAQHPKYFSAFRSCNVGCYHDNWCSECSKCLFTALLLAPHITSTELATIFLSNPLDNTSLTEVLLDLCLPDRVKPFECVGTREESIASARFLLSRDTPFPLLTAVADKLPAGKSLHELLNDWSKEHNLPPECESLVWSATQND